MRDAAPETAARLHRVVARLAIGAAALTFVVIVAVLRRPRGAPVAG